MRLRTILWKELWLRKSRMVSGLLAITLGIAVIVGIQSVAAVSEQAVKIKLDNLGANILVLPQAASVDDYYTADIDAPTFPEDYVERVATSMLPGRRQPVAEAHPPGERRRNPDHPDRHPAGQRTGLQTDLAERRVWAARSSRRPAGRAPRRKKGPSYATSGCSGRRSTPSPRRRCWSAAWPPSA